MAAGIEEPSGKVAGRVTITTTLTSLIPPFAAVVVVVACALLDILEKETAGAVVLGILATAGLTTGTVYQTAKKTPTDQAKVIWGSTPVADVVTATTVEDFADVPVGGGSHRADDGDLTADADALAARAAELRRGGGS